MIEAAKKMASYIRYYVQDTRELSFDSGLFDYALFSFNGLMLLETYADRKKATLEISRVLKYNGLLFFTTPFLDNKIEKKYPRKEFHKEEIVNKGESGLSIQHSPNMSPLVNLNEDELNRWYLFCLYNSIYGNKNILDILYNIK